MKITTTRREAGKLLMAGLSTLTAGAADDKIPMQAPRWELESGEFVQHKGVAALKIPTPAKAVLKDLVFGDGTIEFDMEPGSSGGPGVGFRRKDAGEYEYFYLRPAAKSPQSGDACQYAPVIKKVLLWDLLPQFQGPAPFRLGEWNHVRIVAAGARPRIFVNDMTKAALDIGRLEGNARSGGILLQGPAVYANLQVRPGVTRGLGGQAAVEAEDRRLVRRWELSPFATLSAGQEVGESDLPVKVSGWKPILAERAGLVNLTREYGLPEGRSVAWVRTSIDRTVAGTVAAAIGWSEEVWVFANGKPVFSGKNRYLIPGERKEPDGRCAVTNGQFSLPLQKGRNDIAVAVANGFYGWGLILRVG